METLRWHSMVAAAILLFCATPLKAQNPLEQLEAKLLEQEKIEAQKTSDQKSKQGSENLPIPKSKPAKSLLALPPSADLNAPTLTNGTRSNAPVSKSNLERDTDLEPPYLGMTLERPTGGGLGLRVVEVVAQSPAWKSGFRIDDRILAIAGIAVSDIDAFAGEISKSAPNELIKFLVERRGRQMDINVVLIPRSVAAKTLPNVNLPAEQPPRSTFIAPSDDQRTPRIPQAVDGRGSLGLVLATLSDAFRRQFGIPVFRGASVLEIVPSSPGFMAGLAPGDCIVEIDGMAISNDEDVVRWKQTVPAKPAYLIAFYRGAQLMQTTLQTPPSDSSQGQLVPPSGAFEVTADMLKPEYVQRLQAEVVQLREELSRSQDRIKSLENATSNRSR